MDGSAWRATSPNAHWQPRRERPINLCDANNFAVAYVYFESEPGRRAAACSGHAVLRLRGAGVSRPVTMPETVTGWHREAGVTVLRSRPHRAMYGI